MVNLPGQVNYPEVGKIRGYLKFVKRGYYFLAVADHECHVCFDHMCLLTFRPGQVRSGQPVGVLPAIHRECQVSTTTDGVVTCYEGTKTTS